MKITEFLDNALKEYSHSHTPPTYLVKVKVVNDVEETKEDCLLIVSIDSSVLLYHDGVVVTNFMEIYTIYGDSEVVEWTDSKPVQRKYFQEFFSESLVEEPNAIDFSEIQVGDTLVAHYKDDPDCHYDIKVTHVRDDMVVGFFRQTSDGDRWCKLKGGFPRLETVFFKAN